MSKIGIIGAMQSEITLFCKVFNAAEKNVPGVYEGAFCGHEIFVCQSGVGKVNAAAATQKLIDFCKVEYIINSGVAGGICRKLSTLDIAVSEKLTYHDFVQIEFLKTNPPYTDVFYADERLLTLAKSACEKVSASLCSKGEKGFSHLAGMIVSGDCFVSDSAKVSELQNKYNALCTEMEGAAIAHIAISNKVPFVVIRAISDFADEEAEMSFETLVQIAADRAANIVSEIIKEI